MKNEEIKLLPCPFCGGETEIYSPKMVIYPNGEKRKKEYIARCKNTKCLGRATRRFNSKQEAVSTWNTRKPMQRVVERLEELRKINEEKSNICEEREEMTEALIRCGVAKGYSYSAEIVKKGGTE